MHPPSTPSARPRATAWLSCAMVLSVSLAGCSADEAAPSAQPPSSAESGTGGLPQDAEPVTLDPAELSVDITNRYWPMQVGDRWVYEETDEMGHTQRVEVQVLDQTRTVAAGIEARVVHDVVTEDGQTVEDTYDWYAQDAAGNIWYLGEDTTEYEDDQAVSTAGSWEAGVDDAQPGILLPADPQPGITYRQEYLAGEAEDTAVVLSTTEPAQTPTGTYTDVLLTRDTTPLEPDLAELKFYAPDIGPVLVLQTSGGNSRETLIQTSRGSS